MTGFPMAATLDLTLNSSMAEIVRLNEAFERFAVDHGFSAESQSAANLALEEVVTNVIMHAFNGADGQTVVIKLAVKNGLLEMTVVDSAPPFNPLTAPEADVTRPLEQRRPGGLGIRLLRRMVDRLEYERANGQNQLRMWKTI